jgi:4-hydroxy-2-oxoheptanedioate aldolase
VSEYLRRADVWPLNPEGEIMLGLKIENRRALANAEASLRVPGVAFAEWGPGDMAMSFGDPDGHDPPYSPDMEAARSRVLNACKASGVAFLNMVRPEDVTQRIDEGVRIGGGVREAVEIGRRHTGRTMPW